MNILKTVLILGVCFSFEIATAQLKFNDARIFAPLKGSNTTAGYAVIKNEGQKDVTLVLKSVEKFKASETHETIEEAGKMSMKKVDSFVIAAGQELELKPGGRHLMLFDATESILPGSTLTVSFLVDGKPSEVKFKVIPRVQASGSASGHKH